MPKALAGLRILDLTGALSGPYCSLILGDMGAEVIKIEPPDGDIFRNIGPHYQGEWSGYFVAVNRNKKGIALNLKTEGGLRAFYDLVAVSDVVLDNFRGGVLERLRIDYDTLSAINPRVISCSITGFGPSGPYGSRAAFDLCVQAFSGILSITGTEDGEPNKVGVPIGDLAAGMFGVIGILAALAERSVSGRGQRVDVSMFDSQLSLLTYWIPWYFLSGETPRPLGTGHMGISPHGAYRTGDGQIAMVIGSERFWRLLCDVLDAPQLTADPRFETQKSRRENRHELREIMEEILATRSTAEWMARLDQAGIPAAPVNTVDKAVSEPLTRERNMVVAMRQPRAGEVHMAGNPVKMSRTPGEEFSPTPALGEHTAEVLGDLLGYSREKIEQLQADGAAVVFEPPD
jgi:CoA:oxalate CoA-transferase